MESGGASRKRRALGVYMAGPKETMRLSAIKDAMNAIRTMSAEDARVMVSHNFLDEGACVVVAYK